MSEIHRDRELEHLESMLYTYKVENKSMDAENERLKQEIRKLLAEKDKLRAALENAQQARVSQGKAIIDANNEIERLRAEMAAKISALMDTHDDMADDLENMREALLDIVAVIGLVGANCGDRVMKIAEFALGGKND